MHIRAPLRLDRVEPPMSRRQRRQRVLAWMLGGSLLLHLLVFGLFFVYLSSPPAPPIDAPQSDELQVLFQSNPSPNPSSTASLQPDAPAAVAAGTPTAAPTPPAPDPATLPPTPAPAPPAPAPPPEPPPQPVVEASLPQPAPETPQVTAPQPEPATPAPPPPMPAPRPRPPTVSLEVPPADQPLLSLPPPFVPPEAPLPLPPRPPPPQPPRVARVQPQRNPFAFPTPQNWSFNAAPSTPNTNGARHGFDMSLSDRAGRKDESMQYVGGAHPGADWEARVHAWIAAHSYYPQEAASQGHEGTATVYLRIDRSGRVLAVRLISSSGEPFLDGAWVDAWRGGTVPPFPPGVTDDYAEFNYTVYYRLIRH